VSTPKQASMLHSCGFMDWHKQLGPEYSKLLHYQKVIIYTV